MQCIFGINQYHISNYIFHLTQTIRFREMTCRHGSSITPSPAVCLIVMIYQRSVYITIFIIMLTLMRKYQDYCGLTLINSNVSELFSHRNFDHFIGMYNSL